MRISAVIVSIIFLSFGCVDVEPKDATDAGTSSNVDHDDAEFGGCNAIQYFCNEGYSPNTACTVGEGTCVQTPDEDRCKEGLKCQCGYCEGADVESCDGRDNCFEYESGGEPRFCTRCPDDTCPQGIAYSTCPEGIECTEAFCGDADTGVTVFCGGYVGGF